VETSCQAMEQFQAPDEQKKDAFGANFDLSGRTLAA
jgi:hypothetical protein